MRHSLPLPASLLSLIEKRDEEKPRRKKERRKPKPVAAQAQPPVERRGTKDRRATPRRNADGRSK